WRSRFLRNPGLSSPCPLCCLLLLRLSAATFSLLRPTASASASLPTGSSPSWSNHHSGRELWDFKAGGNVDSLILGFSVALRPDVLWYGFLGCLVGTLVGVLPGIGPLSGISILLPVTFGLDATKAIVMLAGIYYGSQYGGSTTSILMRIPG